MRLQQILEAAIRDVSSYVRSSTELYKIAFESIKTLQGCPPHISENFDCGGNLLTDLVGGPITVSNNYICSNMYTLTSLKGAPEMVPGNFDCSYTSIADLKFAPKIIAKSLLCTDSKIVSLKGIHLNIHSIGREADFTDCPIESNMLGLLKINGLKRVLVLHDDLPRLPMAAGIINRHLRGARNIFDCQEELIDAGLDEYAKL